MDLDQDDLVKHWDKLWNNPKCPNIKIFQWLILHNRILNWDNLRKRGFTGSSRFHLCQTQEEATNDLLDEWTYTTELWDWEASIFHQSDRIHGNIAATIKLWRENYNDQAGVNLYWILTPGMIIWSTWKERNMHIFRNQSWWEGKIEETITFMIRKMMMRSNFQEGSTQPTDQYSRVLEVFHLTTSRKVNSKQIAPNLWKNTGITGVVQEIITRMEAQQPL